MISTTSSNGTFDPITFAYVVKGFFTSKSSVSDNLALVMADVGGELGLMDELVGLSAEIDRAYADTAGDDGINGVFAYDIVEPLGAIIAMHAANHGALPTKEAVYAMGRQKVIALH